MNTRTVIRNNGSEWKFIWLLATIILFVGLILKIQIYFIYLPIFLAAILTFVYGRLKFAEFDNNGLRLYVGWIFKLSFIEVDWDSIEYLQSKFIKKEFRTANKGVSDGLGPPTSVFSFDDDEIVEIELKEKMSVDDKIKLNASNKMMLRDRVVIQGHGKTIQLKEIPDIGLKKFCELAMLFKSGNHHKMKHNFWVKNSYGGIYNAIIFMLPILLFIFIKR